MPGGCLLGAGLAILAISGRFAPNPWFEAWKWQEWQGRHPAGSHAYCELLGSSKR
jgi:hypothetical protein